MDKTSEKVTKDPKRVEAACKGREKYMNKLKESILNNAKKGSGDATNASNETISATNTATSLPPAPITPQDQVILMSMALVYLPSLPWTFVYFLHITLFNLKIKKQANEKQDQPPKRRHML